MILLVSKNPTAYISSTNKAHTQIMKTITKYIDSIRSNIEFNIGQNVQENFKIIDDSKENYLWFHIHHLPSCHVIACINDVYDKKQLHKIAVQGAMLCKQYSKYKSDKGVEVMYTKVQNVSKTDIMGSVNVSDYKVISV